MTRVDKKIIDLVLYGKEMYDFTEGRVNIAMGSVLKIAQREQKIPKKQVFREKKSFL